MIYCELKVIFRKLAPFLPTIELYMLRSIFQIQIFTQNWVFRNETA